MKISAIYRKIFAAVEYKDFEDWAFNTAKALFGFVVGLVVIVIIMALSLQEQRGDIRNLKQRMEAIEKGKR